MTDYAVYFLVLCLGFGLGAVFTNWQRRVEDAIIDEDDFNQQWQQVQMLPAQRVTLPHLPPDWVRQELN